MIRFAATNPLGLRIAAGECLGMAEVLARVATALALPAHELELGQTPPSAGSPVNTIGTSRETVLHVTTSRGAAVSKRVALVEIVEQPTPRSADAGGPPVITWGSLVLTPASGGAVIIHGANMPGWRAWDSYPPATDGTMIEVNPGGLRVYYSSTPGVGWCDDDTGTPVQCGAVGPGCWWRLFDPAHSP